MVHYPVIDCSAVPSVPDGLRILPRDWQLPGRIRDTIRWHPLRADLFQTALQREGIPVSGQYLLGELQDEPVLPASVLDAFLATGFEGVPATWKPMREPRPIICFYGTIYASRETQEGMDAGVRCITWRRARWEEEYRPLSEPFGQDMFAATWFG